MIWRNFLWVTVNFSFFPQYTVTLRQKFRQINFLIWIRSANWFRESRFLLSSVKLVWREKLRWKIYLIDNCPNTPNTKYENVQAFMNLSLPKIRTLISRKNSIKTCLHYTFNFRTFYNWTWNYRKDSDIVALYGPRFFKKGEENHLKYVKRSYEPRGLLNNT